MTRASAEIEAAEARTTSAGPTLRPFDPDRDFPAMVELISAANRHDGIDYFPTTEGLALDWAPSPRFDPRRDQAVIEVDGRFIGAGGVDWRERAGRIVHRIEIWIHPDARRRGHGRRLLDWAEARARATVAEGSGGPAELPHFLGGGVDRDKPEQVRFAEKAGYEPVRYGFVMRRRLAEPIPAVALPPGLEVRPVTPDQHRAIWDADAFMDHHEAGVRDETDFTQFFGHPDVDTTMWQVAWDGSEVAGSVVNGIYPHENAQLGLDIGWLDHVSVRRPWRRRGLASALIARSLAVLRDRGMALAALGVDAENPTGALGVYERLGFTQHQTWVTYRKPLESRSER
jgi:mycothiol synthase